MSRVGRLLVAAFSAGALVLGGAGLARADPSGPTGLPPGSPALTSCPMLGVGSSGPCVLALQQGLDLLGAKLVTDSLFGPATRAAVVDFQRTHGLAEDGIAGPHTLKALEKALSPLPCPRLPSRPTCSEEGAFQADEQNDHGTIVPRFVLPDGEPGPDSALVVDAAAIPVAMDHRGWHQAATFFRRYTAGTGQDLTFDATQAYRDSAAFRSVVDRAVKSSADAARSAGEKEFDSGYQDYDFTRTDSDDWANAIGRGFYRVTGRQQADGAWSVRLQLTSYYQFHEKGNDFPLRIRGMKLHLSQAELRRMVKVGMAKNFRSVGSGTLDFH